MKFITCLGGPCIIPTIIPGGLLIIKSAIVEMFGSVKILLELFEKLSQKYCPNNLDLKGLKGFKREAA